MEKGVNPSEFTAQGGLDQETFDFLNQKRKREKKILKNQKQKLIEKYGSIKETPIKVGPCKKIEPVIGDKSALVLLTEFEDVKHTMGPEFFQDLLFSKGSGRSMRDYYLEASYNQLDIDGTVNNQWFTAPRNINEYIDKTPVKGSFPLAMKLVEETIQRAKVNGVNFKPFAKDGKIELLTIIYAGEGMDTNLSVKTIWPHKAKLKNPIEVEKGIWADRYVLIPEYPLEDIGCICHEMGHLLGLPDFYNNYSTIAGFWCLMAAGGFLNGSKTPAHPSAWCKVHLGWREPTIINNLPNDYDIPAIINDDGMIYKLEVKDSDGKEYFLLENRQKKGFDSYLPDSGLLIWHVDEDHCVNLQPNADPKNYFITLIQSDGKNELQKDKTKAIKDLGLEAAKKDLTGDEGDAYPGITINRTFDDQSRPNSNTYKGSESQVRVLSISDSSEIMKAQIGVLEPSTHSTNKSVDKKDKENFLRFLMAIANSEKKLTPYEEGYNAGIKDAGEKLKEEQGLKLYGKGYKQGNLQGYKKYLKKRE
jgi:immune inhibitor A